MSALSNREFDFFFSFAYCDMKGEKQAANGTSSMDHSVLLEIPRDNNLSHTMMSINGH